VGKNSAASVGLGFHAVCRYSLISPASLVWRRIWVGGTGQAMTLSVPKTSSAQVEAVIGGEAMVRVSAGLWVFLLEALPVGDDDRLCCSGLPT
jgi:hypothetical protein